MEVMALCFRLMMAVMIPMAAHNPIANAASFKISPDKSQFFEYESLTLFCTEDIYDRVIHKANSGNNTEMFRLEGLARTINNVYPEDSGKYWCEAEVGNRSNVINITVTGGSVIMESPALPVMEGDSVTLSCRSKMAASDFTADFYKDGRHISSSSTGNVTILTVSKSDEGLYKCEVSGVGDSSESWLVVEVGSVFLESPILPVMEGESVTLRCGNKMAASDFTVHFYKDGRHISSSSMENVTIFRVSKSDEGLYKCNISGVGESAGRWLAVRGHSPQTQPSDHGCHIYIILRTIFTILMVSLLLLLLGLFQCGKLEAAGHNSRPLRSKRA